MFKLHLGMLKVRRVSFVITILLLVLSSSRANAILLPLGSLQATIDPFTYTDSQGTFTTSQIFSTLNTNAPSFIDVNPSTGDFRMHYVMDITFNDGKPAGGNNLFGTITQDDVGVTPGINIDFGTNATGLISGAGGFDGSEISGIAGHRWGFFFHIIYFDGLLLDPPTGISPDPIPLSGGATATIVPEPSTYLLFATGLLGIIGYSWRKRKLNA